MPHTTHASPVVISLQEAIRPRDVKVANMAAEFLSQAKEALRLLHVPVMSVRTAATLGGVRVATVRRRLKEARDV